MKQEIVTMNMEIWVSTGILVATVVIGVVTLWLKMTTTYSTREELKTVIASFNTTMYSTREELKTVIASFNTAMASFEASNKGFEAANKGLEAAISGFQREVNAMRTEITSINSTLISINGEIQRLHQQDVNLLGQLRQQSDVAT